LHFLLDQTENDELEGRKDKVCREGWSCWLGTGKVTSDPVNTVLQYVYYWQMRDHCKKSKNLAPAAFDMIDWDAIKDSSSASPELFNLWTSKQISGFCPVGKNMQRWAFGRIVNATVATSCPKMLTISASVPMKTDKMHGALRHGCLMLILTLQSSIALFHYCKCRIPTAFSLHIPMLVPLTCFLQAHQHLPLPKNWTTSGYNTSSRDTYLLNGE
jgi:hypothetical protein